MSYNNYSKNRRAKKRSKRSKKPKNALLPYKKTFNKFTNNLFRPSTDFLGMRWPWNVNAVSQGALSLAKKALFNTNAEFKRIEYGQTDVAPTTTPAVSVLYALTQGTSATTRIGDHIKVTDFTFKGTLRASTSMSETSAFRLMLVLQKHNEADSAPAVTDILTAVNTYAFRALPKAKNFKVLFDKVYTVNSNKPYRDLFISWRGQLPVKYDSAISTTKPVSNSLILIWFTNQTSNLPVLDYYYRGHYIDN